MKKTECRNVLEEVLMGTRANTRGASHGSSFVIFRFTQHTARNPENLQRNKGDSLPSDRDLLREEESGGVWGGVPAPRVLLLAFGSQPELPLWAATPRMSPFVSP